MNIDQSHYKINEFKERLYEFTLPGGERRFLTIQQAKSFGSKEMNLKASEILDDIESKRKGMSKKGDGFKPGWQANINEYVSCPALYKNKLKQYGLVEIGNDFIPQSDEINKTICANPEFVKEALRVGVELSGREIEAIESGEFYND